MENELQLLMGSNLPAGCLSHSEWGAAPAAVRLRFGSIVVQAGLAGVAPKGKLLLAPDLWERLAIPYPGIRLQARTVEPAKIELGPAVAVLFAERTSLGSGRAKGWASLYYGDRQDEPGMLGLGYEQSINWIKGTMCGYVLDNRPDRAGDVIGTCFPIPASVRLLSGIRSGVVRRLRRCTGNRTFNSVRRMCKWQFHRLLAKVPEVRDHLPETRLLTGFDDLSAMLERHGCVFVKHAKGLLGRKACRVRQLRGGLEVCHLNKDEQVKIRFASLQRAIPYIQRVTGKERCVVQQGIPITGVQGQAVTCRIITVRDRSGGWWAPVTMATVAPKGAAFTNLGLDSEILTNLQLHYGMGASEAQMLVGRMTTLCLAASRVLEVPFHPLGLLGFDVAVAVGTKRIWLLEANVQPVWQYRSEVMREVARSQADYAIFLTGFAP